MTRDDLNKNSEIKYDYRNLILQLKQKIVILKDSIVNLTFYFYDEAGNRIRKKIYTYKGLDFEDAPAVPLTDIAQSEDWELKTDEIYSRGADGKELAIYNNYELKQWNVWANDNSGKIEPQDNKAFYYLKDHLGSVRVVIDDENRPYSSQDFDAWGYLLDERSFDSDESKYKFTSKERDKESNYDYFGARYYDAKIGRWAQVEPLLDKYPSVTPYNYSLNNPLRIIDPNGADPFEIIVRTYIPFDIVFPGFKGDSRGADPNATSYRTEQTITVETDRNISSTIIQNYDAKISPSILYLPFGSYPTIEGGIGEGTFSAIASYSSDVNEGNNASVQLTGEAHVGVVPSTLSPAIDYSFGITILPQKDGSVSIQLQGSHDAFPGYEIYVKDKTGKLTLIYNPPDPNNSVIDPFRLYPPTDVDVNQNTIIP